MSKFEIDQRSRAGITGRIVLKYHVIDRRSRTRFTKLERFHLTILGGGIAKSAMIASAIDFADSTMMAMAKSAMMASPINFAGSIRNLLNQDLPIFTGTKKFNLKLTRVVLQF